MDNSALILMLGLFGLWFFVLRTRKSPIGSAAEFESRIRGGQPVVAQFFSNT